MGEIVRAERRASVLCARAERTSSKGEKNIASTGRNVIIHLKDRGWSTGLQAGVFGGSWRCMLRHLCCYAFLLNAYPR